MDLILSTWNEYIEFLRVSWSNLIIFSGIMIVVLWSASYSASVAEIKLRRPSVHFFIGLLVPVIYPFVALWKLPVYSGSNRRNQKRQAYEKGEGPPPVEVAPPLLENAPPALVNADMLEKSNVEYDQSYFKKIAIDVAGNYRGPFFLTISGEKLKVERIIDPLPNVLLVEFISADGKLQNMRIPYKNIESCTEM